MKGRGPWHQSSTVPMDGMTPLGLALLDAIAELARNGIAMPSNQALGLQLGCSPCAISRLLVIFEREQVIRLEKRGRTFSLQRRVTIVATGAQTAPMIEKRSRQEIERATYFPVPVTPGPPVRDDLKVVRTRCPMCEMPPGHAQCAHGWDGHMTRRQRRAAAEAVAIELVRAA